MIGKTYLMKKALTVLVVIFIIISCKKTPIEKPDNLIAKDKMVDILYDISLLEALKTQNLKGGIKTETENRYIYEKYGIDSIQLVKSNLYYTYDLVEYKKMCELVKAKLKEETDKLEKSIGKLPNQIPSRGELQIDSNNPQIQ